MLLLSNPGQMISQISAKQISGSDRSQLPSLLIPQLTKISLPKKLQLIRFEEFPPQIQELLKAITQQGTEI